jgi:hypothetical protein
MERVAGRIYSSALRRSSSPDREHRGGKVIMKGGSLWGGRFSQPHFSFCKCGHNPLISKPARNGSFCKKVLVTDQSNRMECACSN